jgi:hypothetical protein
MVRSRTLAALALFALTTSIHGQGQSPAKPADVPLLMQADALRGAAAGAVRVPIVVGAETREAVNVRVRVLSPAAGGAAPKVMAEETMAGGPGRFRAVKEFALAAGVYDIETTLTDAKDRDRVVAQSRSSVTIPNIWSGPLALTPIVLAEKVTGGMKRTDLKPFNFGPTAVEPAVSGRFAQSGVVNVAFRIFNWKAELNEKPDLTVEYLFYQQSKRLNFFNKIKPQHLAADSLGDTFDPQAGVVTAGMMIPLAPFPFGEFEMKVKVTDNRTKQSSERDVRFSVVP